MASDEWPIIEMFDFEHREIRLYLGCLFFLTITMTKLWLCLQLTTSLLQRQQHPSTNNPPCLSRQVLVGGARQIRQHAVTVSHVLYGVDFERPQRGHQPRRRRLCTRDRILVFSRCWRRRYPPQGAVRRTPPLPHEDQLLA